jgi:hypothetical protein
MTGATSRSDRRAKTSNIGDVSGDRNGPAQRFNKIADEYRNHTMMRESRLRIPEQLRPSFERPMFLTHGPTQLLSVKDIALQERAPRGDPNHKALHKTALAPMSAAADIRTSPTGMKMLVPTSEPRNASANAAGPAHSEGCGKSRRLMEQTQEH